MAQLPQQKSPNPSSNQQGVASTNQQQQTNTSSSSSSSASATTTKRVKIRAAYRADDHLVWRYICIY